MSLTIRRFESLATQRLRERRVESAAISVRAILKKALALDDVNYILASERELSASQLARLENLLARREKNEPLAYVLGEKEFYKNAFGVSEGVLLPRPETEALVEIALNYFGEEKIIFADLGCGSGCVGLSILAERPAWRGLLLDNSATALRQAARNAARVAPKAKIIAADIFNLPFANSSLNLIVANLPYVAIKEIASVQPYVLAWEPLTALFSPMDGLEHIRAALAQATRVLKPEGAIILEHGSEQRAAIMATARSLGFSRSRVYDDMAGLPRVFMAIKS